MALVYVEWNVRAITLPFAGMSASMCTVERQWYCTKFLCISLRHLDAGFPAGTGSKEYLRLMKRHARTRGMFLTPYGLLRHTTTTPAAADAAVYGSKGAAVAVAAGAVAAAATAGCAAVDYIPSSSSGYGVGGLVMVPDEGPPWNADQKEWWPPGWGDQGAQGSGGSVAECGGGRGVGCRGKRVVMLEKDVFELLGLPWREPWQRNCPS